MGSVMTCRRWLFDQRNASRCWSLRGAICTLFAIALIASATVAADPIRIVALGDSLTAGYGLPQNEGFVAQLQDAIDRAGIDAMVIDAGVSGDTTAGGLARIDWALADGADAVLVELGANDALRGIDPAASRANLQAIIEELVSRDVEILLVGMLAPRNLGGDYVAAFDAMYGELAEEHDTLLYPFFLEGVAANPDLNQSDGIHPNREGVAVIVDGIWDDILLLLARVEAKQ
jgi:acyl-CoA thioesterase-1